MKDEFDIKIPKINKPKIDHLNRQIPPKAHTPMYNWHKFWSRKTWNVVAEFIKTYCPKNRVVFDPFAGSGVVAMEALRQGKRVIICDLLPISTEIARLTIKPVSLLKLQEAYQRSLIDFDKKILAKIEKKEIKEWYPRQKLYHINGKPFMKKEKYESIDELFTKRNLQALAWLMEAIEEETNKELRDFLKIGFSSMVHLATCMMPDRPTRPFSGGWTEHSYWFATEFMEQNVWDLFESAIVARQGLLNAKEESNKYFKNVRFGTTYKEVIEGKAEIFIYDGSCFDLMKEMSQDFNEKGGIDYIFTDPPYDSSIQYGELAFLWIAWLKKDKGYLERIAADEVIHNEHQDKDFEVYHSLLSRSFQDMFRVLKPDTYVTITFHNPTFKVRNATIYAGVFAGFEFQKVHHQELARPSAKSLLQPFGSAQGDFYLRFYKLPLGEGAIKPVAIDEIRFEKIVVETTIKVIAERGEPTPYTIIINAIDPELARQGFFSELKSGLDVKKVLGKHLNKEFILVSAKVGDSEGKLWWFKNPSMVPHLESVPLSERVEQTVLRKLQERGRVTFTEIWDAVSTEFPNSLTSDSMSIIDALKAYARPVTGGYWLIKPDFQPNEIEKIHTTIIAILAEIGKAKGFKIWVGKIEQNHKITGLPNKSGELKQYMSIKNIRILKNIQNPDTVEDIDLLWAKDNRVVYLFEIESTTSMTSGLQRGSNVEIPVPKFLVIPEETEAQFLQKLKSPLFSEGFVKDNWKILYFGALIEEFSKHKGRTNVEKLVEKKVLRKANKEVKNQDQLDLFNN